MEYFFYFLFGSFFYKRRFRPLSAWRPREEIRAGMLQRKKKTGAEVSYINRRMCFPLLQSCTSRSMAHSESVEWTGCLFAHPTLMGLSLSLQFQCDLFICSLYFLLLPQQSVGSSHLLDQLHLLLYAFHHLEHTRYYISVQLHIIGLNKQLLRTKPSHCITWELKYKLDICSVEHVRIFFKIW